MLIADAPDMHVADVSGLSSRAITKHVSSSIRINGAQAASFSLLVRSSNRRQTSVFAAIKGNSSPRFQDELMRSHPVAINGLWMHSALSNLATSRRSAFNCCTDPVPASRNQQHKSVSDCARGRWSVTTDRSLCVVTVSLYYSQSVGRLFDVIREPD